MRRIWLALLLALCCLLCMACASGETKQLVTADGLTQEAAVNTQQPVVLYSFETKSVEKEYRAEDGTLMATAHYALPVLTPSFWSNGRLACVEMQGYSFTGGVHGYTTRAAAAFDLSDGRSVAVSDLSRDWSGLQQAVTRELLRQAGELVRENGEGMLFDDYETTIADWSSRTILFGEGGMTVVFGVYDIAPYVAGEQMFAISYDLIAPYLNDYGKALIGLT